MRILFIDTDYPEVVRAMYATKPWPRGYDELLALREETLFGFTGFLAAAATASGNPSMHIYPNHFPLQASWLGEHLFEIVSADAKGFFLPKRSGMYDELRRYWRYFIYLRRLHKEFRSNTPPDDPFLYGTESRSWDIIAQQIDSFRPDVVYNLDPYSIDGKFLASLKPRYGALVSQIAAPIDPSTDWSIYDLVISSLPSYVEMFNKQNIPAAYLPLFFVPNVLDKTPKGKRDISISFVGNVTDAHAARREFLISTAENLPVPLALYGRVSTQETQLRPFYKGEAWGRDMYAVLGRSQLTLNKHIDIAAGYANNLRLYESTGMGSCLITDNGSNLPELFERGREVLVYDSVDECVDLCRFYLAHPEAASAIARAGQLRCLAEHTVEKRTEQMMKVLKARL